MSGTTPRRSGPGGGALTKKLPTGLVAQLVVGTTSNGYLSSWSQVRAHGGERNPCELGG